MKRVFFYILACVLAAMAALNSYAQTDNTKRRITPVEQSTNRTLLPRKGEKLKYVERDSITLDSLRRDSIAKIYPRYPKITELTFGLSFSDAIARLFGQKYSNFDIMASVNMWNRLFPTAELGVGFANSTPDGQNYTYKTPLSFYAKLGADYNMMFKKHPKYQFLVGVRVGYTSFKYDLTDVTVTEGYWDESVSVDLRDIKSHALFGEVRASIKVQLYGPISAGWTLRYKMLFNSKNYGEVKPWYIPGFGTREAKVAASFSIYYTIPQSKKEWPNIDSDGNLLDDVNPYDDVVVPEDAISQPAEGETQGAEVDAESQQNAEQSATQSGEPQQNGNPSERVDIKADVKAINADFFRY